jgi:hypothetical protein
MALLYARCGMTKNELITKQQIEIEDLKAEIDGMKSAINEARNHLWRPEQWNPKCADFPRVAMIGIVSAREVLNSI